MLLTLPSSDEIRNDTTNILSTFSIMQAGSKCMDEKKFSRLVYLIVWHIHWLQICMTDKIKHQYPKRNPLAHFLFGCFLYMEGCLKFNDID